MRAFPITRASKKSQTRSESADSKGRHPWVQLIKRPSVRKQALCQDWPYFYPRKNAAITGIRSQGECLQNYLQERRLFPERILSLGNQVRMRNKGNVHNVGKINYSHRSVSDPGGKYTELVSVKYCLMFFGAKIMLWGWGKIREIFRKLQAERNKTIQMSRERICASENEITKLCKSGSCAALTIIMHLKMN